MQEHIRRAHPEYYIPKLPATRDSFELMVNSPPSKLPQSERSAQTQPHSQAQAVQDWSPPSRRAPQSLLPDTTLQDGAGLSMFNNFVDFQSNSFGEGSVQQISHDAYYNNDMTAFIPRSASEFRRGSLLPAASAAAALAQLHYAGWEGDAVGEAHTQQGSNTQLRQNLYHEQVADDKPALGLDPTLSAEQHFLTDQFPTSTNDQPQTTPHLLPSSLARSPGARSSTIPSVQRSASRANRPRKSSLTQEARKAKHERHKYKDHMRKTSHDRKAFSVEPNAAALYGKRWEDLIDAATSATEEDSRDLTPVGVFFAHGLETPGTYPDFQIAGSPYHSPRAPPSRTSLPPFALGSQFQSYTASPLQNALTPPPADALPDLQPFPSVESESVPTSVDSVQSGTNFHIMPSGALSSDSSPMFSNPVQIYCAGCRRLSVLKDSYACPECICGICTACVEALLSERAHGRTPQCPKCRTMGGQFKPFQLDIR